MSTAAAGRLATFRRVASESGTLWACALACDRALPFGTVRLWQPIRVPAARLADQIARIFRSWGMPEAHVTTTVDRMLYADLRGIDTHGCCMLPFYQRLWHDGVLNPNPAIAVVRETASTALVDGGGGLGHVAATFAMTRAIDMALAGGVGVVAVRNSGHFGAAGAYAAMAADQGLIGLTTCSTPTPAVVPTFGREARLGTNPLALSAPAARNAPFLLDMATSTVSLGKLLERWRRGRRIPRGWATDAHGAPVTDGHAASRSRRLTPLGGTPEGGSHKGYGLAVAVEILSAVLPGLTADLSTDGRRARVGHFCLAIDPARFGQAAGFPVRMDALIESLRDTPPVTPSQPVLVAGDPERAIQIERTASGIPLTKAVFEDLRGVAHAARVPFVLDQAGA
jgi:LDH2 family malate/lactate/ureidoglycolate dehydrogenase